MAGTADYDKPRQSLVDAEEADEVQALGVRRGATEAAEDPTEAGTAPGLDPIDDDLTVAVVPMLADEFRCARCFLVYHRTQLAGQRDGEDLCPDCY